MRFLAGTLLEAAWAGMLLGFGLFQANYLPGFVTLQTGTALAAPVTARVLSGRDANPQNQWEMAIGSRATPGTGAEVRPEPGSCIPRLIPTPFSPKNWLCRRGEPGLEAGSPGHSRCQQLREGPYPGGG